MRARRLLTLAIAVGLIVLTTAVVAGAHPPSGRTVLGAPNQARMTADHHGDVRWILPGPRRLDPGIFGTPVRPRLLDLLPAAARATNAAGDAYTTTAGPGPFSDDWAPITGEAKVRVVDITSVAGPTTRDRIDAEFEFTSPDGRREYRVVVHDALPEIPDHENFGGVGINVVQHGRTGIGTPLMPQVMAFIAFWGAADLYVDGQLAQSGRFVHFMLSERVRDREGDYSLAFDDGVDPDSMEAHLILPPILVGADGPNPVPTGFVLPNGNEQPFLHIMYEDVKIRR